MASGSPAPPPRAHPDPVVDALLGRLDATDPGVASDARTVLEWLLPDEGLSGLSQFGVQQFCWYDLPFKWLVVPAVRAEVVEALARFLDLAGLGRYAALCRSSTTGEVWAAWDEDPTAGFRAFRRAAEASGVEPPAVEGLEWGSLMGRAELDAFRSTAQALELAVVAGRLRPGSRGWRAVQLEVARTHLEAPQAELFGQTPLLAAVTERLGHWVESGSTTPVVSRARAQILSPVANQLLHPVPLPRAAARAVGAVSWFVGEVGDAGLRLTASGALPPALARAAVDAHPRWGRGRTPRRAGEVAELAVVEAITRRSGLVRRRGSRLERTGTGNAVVGGGRTGTTVAWDAVVGHLVTGDDLAAATRELLLGVLLADGTASRPEAVAEVGVALTESGWVRGLTGEPVPAAGVRTELDRLVAEGRLLALLREEGPRAGRRLRLTATGEAAARAALRARALRPARPSP